MIESSGGSPNQLDIFNFHLHNVQNCKFYQSTFRYYWFQPCLQRFQLNVTKTNFSDEILLPLAMLKKPYNWHHNYKRNLVNTITNSKTHPTMTSYHGYGRLLMRMNHPFLMLQWSNLTTNRWVGVVELALWQVFCYLLRDHTCLQNVVIILFEQISFLKIYLSLWRGEHDFFFEDVISQSFH